MKTKNLLISILTGMITFLLIVGGIYWYYTGMKKSGDIESMMVFAPEKPLLILSYQDLTTALKEYGIMNEDLSLSVISEEQKKELEETLGFPVEPKDLFQQARLNPFGATSVIIASHNDSECGLLYVPSLDGQGTADFILNKAKEAFKDNPIDEKISTESLSNGELMIFDAGIPSAGWLATDKWLIIGVCMAKQNTKELLSSLGNFDTKDSAFWKRVKPLTDEYWNALLALNLDIPENKLAQIIDILSMASPELGKPDIKRTILNTVSQLDSLAMSYALTGDEVSMSAIASYSEKGKLTFAALNNPAKDQIMEQIPGEALIAARGSLDLKLILKSIQTNDPESYKQIEGVFQSAQGMLKLDPKADFIDQLSPPGGFALVKDSKSPDTMNVGLSLWTNLVADHKINSFLARLSNQLEENSLDIKKSDNNGNPWYDTDFAGWGVVKDQLVFGVGKGTKESLQSKMGSGSLLNSMPTDLKNIMSGDAIFAVGVDIQSLIPILKSIPILDIPKEALEMAESAGHFAIEVHAIEETKSLNAKITLKAASENGFAELFKQKVLPELQPKN